MSRYLPKSIVCLREGVSGSQLGREVIAGLTVGVIALPLAMAFGIASIPADVARDAGVLPPAMGLYTAVVAGLLISLLGGSRVQIGGPTGAFIVIVYSIAARHGYAGLATATLMAGVIIIMGLARFGAMIKFIPYPVTTGFTSGIAVIIASSQLKDFFGLKMKDPNAIARRRVPGGVEVYEINGPFFFGVADRLQDTLRGLERPPKVFILRMRRVPAMDATGLHALDEFHKKCKSQGTTLLLSGVHAQPRGEKGMSPIIDNARRPRVASVASGGSTSPALRRGHLGKASRHALALESTLRPRGRPRKQSTP